MRINQPRLADIGPIALTAKDNLAPCANKQIWMLHRLRVVDDGIDIVHIP